MSNFVAILGVQLVQFTNGDESYVLQFMTVLSNDPAFIGTSPVTRADPLPSSRRPVKNRTLNYYKTVKVRIT